MVRRNGTSCNASSHRAQRRTSARSFASSLSNAWSNQSSYHHQPPHSFQVRLGPLVCSHPPSSARALTIICSWFPRTLAMRRCSSHSMAFSHHGPRSIRSPTPNSRSCAGSKRSVLSASSSVSKYPCTSPATRSRPALGVRLVVHDRLGGPDPVHASAIRGHCESSERVRAFFPPPLVRAGAALRCFVIAWPGFWGFCPVTSSQEPARRAHVSPGQASRWD